MTELKNEIDFRTLVINSLDKVLASGTVEKKIEETLTKTISEIVEDTFKSWSSFGKELKEVVQKAINVNLQELTLPEYNQLVLNAIRQKINETIQAEGFTRLKADIEKMLIGERKEWKLSELVEELKKETLEDESDADEFDEISLFVENFGSSNLVWIYLDQHSDKSKYECNIQLAIYNGQVDSVRMIDKDFTKNDTLGCLHGIEALLFRLYAQKVNFIIDEENVDKYYPSDED
jgi:hypothetical protein